MTPDEAPVSDAVTLIPSGCHAQWQAGRWVMTPPSERYFSTPSVDALLVSLAQGLGSQAAGVILSGAGSDGAHGAAMLLRLGGRVWIQSLRQARFDGMPAAAHQAAPGAPLLAVEDIPAQWLGQAPPMLVTRSASVAALAELIAHVRRATGVDFSGYKPETLERRAAKRLEQLGLASLAAYVEFVAAHPQEAWALQRRFLVSVSSFFRDRPAFEALGQAWRQDRPSPDPWRCWVPACATGEEAYTLAMLHAEGVRAGAWARGLEVLGTDLNTDALQQARQAIYDPKATREMDDAMCQRYFTPHEQGLAVAAPIRAPVHFDCQDLLSRQPEGPWHVISCRNLLIYLQTPLQERLMADFHARMAPGGWLFISPAETLPQASLRWFSPHDMDHRIYRRVP
jgi:chemotaxis methyl-accepting protein methylase